VAYSPDAVTIFQGLTRYLNKNGLPSDYVLYSSYDALVTALDRGEIEIAWNTPLAHARYHVKNECQSQTLVMRDVLLFLLEHAPLKDWQRDILAIGVAIKVDVFVIVIFFGSHRHGGARFSETRARGQVSGGTGSQSGCQKQSDQSD
jgi:hypothetical protein